MVLDDREVKDRYLGCLVGLAIGNALGAPVRFVPGDAVKQRYGQLREMVGGGWLLLDPGSVTDPAEMAMALARSLVKQRNFDAADVVDELIAWIDSQPRHVDKLVRASLGLVRSGISSDDAARLAVEDLGFEPSGSASMSRCPPIGLLYARQQMLSVGNSRAQSRLSHWSETVGWACAAVNLLIGEFVAGRADAAIARTTGSVDDLDVNRTLEMGEKATEGDLASSGSALDSLQCAVWCVVHHDTFEETLIAAVNLGGEADTVGAVAGALAGALHGKSKIPDRWLAELAGRDEIAEQALALYQSGWLG